MIYLDHNSTTPCAPEVVAEMLPYFAAKYGNAESPHEAGRIASQALSTTRQCLARITGTQPETLFFTSGATEANNLALLGVAQGNRRRNKIAVSAIEHKSVLEPAHHLARHGFAFELLPVDRNGVVDLNAVERIIDDQTLIVSVQGANNETGVIQPIQQIAHLAHDRGALCHCDAAQLLGKEPVDIEAIGVDMASFSAHKMYGPKGIGALFIAPTVPKGTVSPLFFGGRQENGLRPGTQNIPAIAGFGCACRIVNELLLSEMERIRVLRDRLETLLLSSLPESRVNGIKAPRLPGTISLTVPGIPADMLLSNLDAVCVSDGSACNSGTLDPSHVLLAMGLSRADAECTLRISLGRYTEGSEINAATEELTSSARMLFARLGSNQVKE